MSQQAPQLASGERLETPPVSVQSFPCPALDPKDLGARWKLGHGGCPQLSALTDHTSTQAVGSGAPQV